MYNVVINPFPLMNTPKYQLREKRVEVLEHKGGSENGIGARKYGVASDLKSYWISNYRIWFIKNSTFQHKIGVVLANGHRLFPNGQ